MSRDFFRKLDYLEVTTDHIVPSGAFESVLDVLEVSGQGQLHTSPEFEMKVLLSKYPFSLYQICRCFRDDPITSVHGKEFTMLEFYEVGASYSTIQERMRDYLQAVAGRVLSIEKRSFGSLLEEHTGLLLTMDRATMQDQCARRGIRLSRGDSLNDIVLKAWVQEVETRLSAGPVLVHDYPGQFAALAKTDPQTGLARRFEIYWHGIEICNGCEELTDLPELKRRRQTEKSARLGDGKADHVEPQRLIEAFAKGLPQCAGVAVGLERVYQCLHSG